MARSQAYSAKVVDIDSMRNRLRERQKIVRLAPELDGIEMLYQMTADQDLLYGMPILFWALHQDGRVIGMVPWMDQILSCHQLNDPDYGFFVGYRDPETHEVMSNTPSHKAQEIKSSAQYFDYEVTDTPMIIQQLPETQGTYVLCLDAERKPWLLKPVHGWRLYSNGMIEALLVDENLMADIPVTMSDSCLYPANSRHYVLYFFQRSIANKIKRQEPETIEALTLMIAKKFKS